jgi:hypothetical protein
MEEATYLGAISRQSLKTTSIASLVSDAMWVILTSLGKIAPKKVTSSIMIHLKDIIENQVREKNIASTDDSDINLIDKCDVIQPTNSN